MGKTKTAKSSLKNNIKTKLSKNTGILKALRTDNHGDLWIVLLTLILVVFGTVMIFSASYYKSISEAGDPYVYLRKQAIWAFVGFCAMWVLSNVDYHWWGRLYKPIAIVCLILLCLIFTPLGLEANGATRWIGVGPFTVMPGELAKFGLIMFIT